MDKYICLKCGGKFEQKPIEHGVLYPTVFGMKLKKDIVCKGKVIKIREGAKKL